MQLFDLLFPLFMIGLPAVMALCLRTKETTGQEDRLQHERRLCIATGVSLALVIVVWTTRFVPESSSVFGLLAQVIRSLLPTALLAQAGFFILWFRFAMPLIRVYRPGIDEAGGGQATSRNAVIRSASLTPRKPPSALHFKSTIWTLGLWIVGFMFFLYGWNTYGVPEGKSASQHIILCGMYLIAALSVALVIPLGHRTMFLSPEPLHAGRSVELATAYRNKHIFQARMILGSILFVISLILLFPVSLAFHWQFSGSDWGLIGGIFGATIGTAGGVIGTMTSLHRLKIHRIEQGELEGQG